MATEGWKVLVDRRVEKDVKRAPAHVVERLVSVLDHLAEDPLVPRAGFDTRPLAGRRGSHRVRIGTWRLIYSVDERQRIVRVTHAAPRKTAYR